MALDFPINPSVGQIYVNPFTGAQYVWTGSRWTSYSTPQTLRGTTGPTGPPGGPTGPTGDVGPQGAQGAQGVQGVAGATGQTGNSGTSGSSGTSGVNGVTGANGTSGTSGSRGYTGATGSNGSSGVNGSTGSTGATGSNGTSGVNGVTGATGPAGSTGATGNSPISHSFNVTNSGTTNWSIDTQLDPAVTLYRGFTYTFIVNAPGFNFWIKTTPSVGTGNAYNDGVNNNGISVGTITFTVPLDAPATLYYNDQIYGQMAGQINVFTVSSGSSGTSGSSGSSGSSGVNGATGASGTSGTSGARGLTGNPGSTGATGSNGTSGTSGITPSSAQNYVQTLGSQVTISTANSTVISQAITTTGKPVKITVTGDANPLTAGAWCRLRLYRDGTAIGNAVQAESSASNENCPYALDLIDTPAAGTYTYSLRVEAIAGNFIFGESAGPVINIVELAGSGTSGTSGLGGSSSFTLPSTTTSTWVLLGTWNTNQSGATLYMRVVAHAGFNADIAQNQVTELYFKTSNGTSNQSGFYGDGLAYRNTSLGPNTQVPESFRIVQVSTTQYQVYAFFNAAFIHNSTYSLQYPSNTVWTNSSAATSAPSGTFINITPSAGKAYAFLQQAAVNTTTDSAFTWNINSANGITVSGANITLVNPGTYSLLASLQLRSTYAVYQWTNSSGAYLQGTVDGVAAAVNSSDSAVPQPAMGIITTTGFNTVIQLRLRTNLGLVTSFQVGAPAQIIQIA
jgi:hypothetical protein